mmetsp:Transcript_4081/g.7849  ORF Transcript_4081/g.7849 Transcript_4081/m.7849 type:complete len:263 (-) Transcript_4081:163-951(-)
MRAAMADKIASCSAWTDRALRYASTYHWHRHPALCGIVVSTRLVAYSGRRTLGFVNGGCLRSTRKPLPMVEEIVQRLKYWPTAAEGLAFSRPSMKCVRLLTRASFVKLTLPTGQERVPLRSVLNATCPCLHDLMPSATSMVIVPILGFGIRPRGPRILATLPTIPMQSGVARTRSKLSSPSFIFSARSSAPTTSAPAVLASSAFGPFAKTATRMGFPSPYGSSARPLTIWFGLRGSTPSFTLTSTVSSNRAVEKALTSFTAS